MSARDEEEAVVPSETRGLLETIRCRDGVAPLLARHQERLAGSWRHWFRGAPPALVEIAGSAIAATRGVGGLVRIAFARNGREPAIAVTRRPLPPAPRHCRVAIAATARMEPAAERSVKQLDRAWVERLAVAGVDETLVFDDEHGLLEGTRSNLFVWRGRELVTPPVASGLVPGVVRAEWIARAAEFGLTVVERAVTANDLRRCGALVLTGSGLGVVAVAECDGRPVGSASGREAVRRVRTRLLSGG
ncbi:MAG: hypothetical protein FJ293_10390 [Planctomycetes bacterium]|nr:hypothetical protein [Planctomycetota bacterium]